MSKARFLVPLLIILAAFPLHAQDKGTLDDWLMKAFQSTDSSEYYFSEALPLLRSKADSANYTYFRFFRNDAARLYDSTLYYAKQLIPQLEFLDSSNRLRKVYVRLHYAELNNGKYDEALNYINNAITLAEKLKDTAMISLHYSDKSIIYHDFEDYARGVETGKRAYRIMASADDIQYKYLIYANNATAINFDDWGKADSALSYHYRNVELLNKVEDSISFAFIYNNIGNTNLKQGNYKEARKYLLRALEMNKIRNRDYNLATNYTNLATIAYELNDFNEAESYFKLANFHANKSTSIEKIRDVVQQEAWYYKKTRDFKKALERQEAYYKLRDSVFNEDRATRFAEMETKYETEKNIRQLAETRANLAETELKVKRRNNLIFGSLGLSVILGLLGYLLYNQQKLKNRQLLKENELREALIKIETQNKLQEQRLRISRDLHDNIGAQLTFIISSIDNLKFGLKHIEDATIDRLTQISNFTSATIFELRDTIWAMNKSSISMEDLESRILNFIERANESSDGTNFSFEIDPNISTDLIFSSVEGMNVYRIIQEAVNNALKYAEASIISVRISKKDSDYEIRVTDNGKGFDLDKVGQGNGLNNIKKRAKDIGGSVKINSSNGGGTAVILTFSRKKI